MRRPCVLLLLALTAQAEWWGDGRSHLFTSRNRNYEILGSRSGARPGDGTTLQLSGSGRGRGVIFRHKLARHIVEVEVLDDRPAAILFERFLDSVMLLDETGVAWRVPATKLFDAKEQHGIVDGHAVWRRAWWTDEARGKAVFVSYAGAVHEIDLKTGTVWQMQSSAILTGIRLPWARKKALEVAADFQPPDVRKVAEPIARNEKEPVAVRLRAAIAVQRAGGDEVNVDLFTAAVAKEESLADRKYAVREAPYVLGHEAHDWLEEVGVDKDLTKDVVDALVPLGGAAVRSLVYLIAHSEVQQDARKYAAKFLPQLPKEVVLKATLKELKDADAQIGGVLLGAAIATGGKDLGDRMREHDQILLDILARQTGPLEWLTDYFRERPTTEAVKPLLNALRKHRGNAKRRAKIIAALKPCTGLDFGDNVDAWLKKTPRN